MLVDGLTDAKALAGYSNNMMMMMMMMMMTMMMTVIQYNLLAANYVLM